MGRANYYINGKNLKDFGVHVSASSGVLGLPKLRKPKSHVWEDYHGEVVDLKAKYYEPRNIRLQCFIKANNEADFAAKMVAFTQEFSRPGTSRLQIDVIPEKPLVYEVYCPSAVDPKKEWDNGQMVGTFSLNLVEAEPLKRVLKITGQPATVSVKAPKIITIHWGDGEVITDIEGERDLSHSYPSSDTYYITISGGVEDIENLTTNAEVVWNRL